MRNLGRWLLLLAMICFSAPSYAGEGRAWNGPYIGLLAGWGSIDNRFTHSDGNPPPFSIDADGGFGGIFSGYNWRSGNTVLGIESDTSLTGMSGEWGAMTDHTADIRWLSTFRGRVGLLVNPSTLVYATGGLAIARVRFEHVGHHSWDDTFFGWTLGGGIERVLFGNIKGAIEGLYMDFSEETSPGHLHGNGASCAVGTPRCHAMSNAPDGFVVRAKLSIPLGDLLK
ncbi:MAG: outer membrane beta-barrel protein [Hyphomicrobiaceae bacterium]